jgi:hypothetical protein
MFNMYTKLATALGAFALLFSTGAWAQCDAEPGTLPVDYTIGGGAFTSEIDWLLNAADGTTVLSGGLNNADGTCVSGNPYDGSSGTLCLAPGDYTFIGSDCWGDGWNGNEATFEVNGFQIGFFTILGVDCAGEGCSSSITFTVPETLPVPGCTDETACNYDAAATADDGTCDFTSCVGCSDDTATNYCADCTIADDTQCIYCAGILYEFTIFDQYSDGMCCAFGNGSYAVTIDGVEVAAGGEFGASETTIFCADDADACVIVTVNTDAWGSETTWQLRDATTGGLIQEGGPYENYFVNYPSANPNAQVAGTSTCVGGCTDPTGCNYNSEADFNDGSCDFSCYGCTDATALNYDPTALIDDGSCAFCEGAFAGTLTVGGGAYPTEVGWSLVLGDLTLAAGVPPSGAPVGPIDLCLEPGCYIFNMVDTWGDGWNGNTFEFTTYAGETVFSGSITDAPDLEGSSGGNGQTGSLQWDLNGGACTTGCTDATACNYDATAAYEDGSCDYSCIGCLDPAAANYNANATVDGGNCVYCDAGTFVLTVDMADSFGDGWPSQEYFIYAIGDATGLPVASGSIGDAFLGDGLSSGTDLVCLAPGCYSFEVSSGVDNGEVSITLSDQFGTEYATLGAPAAYNLDFAETGLCGFAGCIDETANNYDPSATIDDGSCEFPPVNDNVENAAAIACGASVWGTLEYANDNEGLAGTNFGQLQNGLNAASIWYVINSDSDQLITVNTCETPSNDGTTDYVSDTRLALFSLDAGGDLTILATNDDFCGLKSSISWTATTGSDYYIRVERYSEFSSGNEVIVTANCTPGIVAPSNDECDDAIAQVSGQTYEASMCGANALSFDLWTVGGTTLYGVWYTFNSADYDTFDFNLVNGTSGNLGWAFSSSDCAGFAPELATGLFTGQFSGSIEDFVTLTPDTDYYFVIFTTDPEGCGDYTYTTTGNYLGCTDESANNYDGQATIDDGTCDYDGVVPANDTCGDAIALECNSSNVGSTGGATAVDAPTNIANCIALPGAGVWYSFVGDGSLHTLSTCGSVIDSQVNLLAADTECGQFTCVEGAISSDGNGICSFFDQDDVNMEFISIPGQQYYVYVSSGGAAGAFNLDFTCEDVVEGCTDASACNYDPAANVDDASCDIFSCVCSTETGSALQFSMSDSGGNGWQGGSYTIETITGDIIASGSLDDALSIVDVDNISGADSGYDLVCLEPGCYNVVVVGGTSSFQMSWQLLTEDGTLLSAGGVTEGTGVQIGDAVCGCTDIGACNYSIDATNDDDSCEYDTCAGCTDNTSCSFDAAATIDDGSCCYDNCVTISMNDDFGDGWNGAAYTLTDVSGNVVGTGTILTGSFGSDFYCLPTGCYQIQVSEGSWPSEVSWSISGAFGGLVQGALGADDTFSLRTFNVGSGDACVVGCDIACACNYNPDTNIPDVASCIFDGCAGCTYEGSAQYDEAAIVDDGSCTFEFANPCPADLNGDGSVSTADLLEFLTAFGQIC